MITLQIKLATSLLTRLSSARIWNRSLHQTYYDVLKIQPNCTSKEVRDAFINLSKQNHPDKHLNDPSMHDRFVKINEAYSVLINPSSRKEYDRTLVQKRNSGNGSASDRGDAYFYQSTYQYRRRESNPKRSSYNSRQGKNKQDFYSYSWEAHSDTKTKNNTSSNESYYGIKGLKKISNSVIVSCLVIFSAVTFIVQMLTIKSHAQKSRDRDLEASRKNSLLLAMAREKAKLYGNEHQINILKQSLEKTQEPFPPHPVVSPSKSSGSSPTGSESGQGDVSSSTPAPSEPVGKPCKKCKKTVKPVMAV